MTAIPLGPIGIASKAIADRLKTVLPSTQFTHQWLPGKMDRSVWELITRRCPSLSVEYVGFERADVSAKLIGTPTWVVWTAVKNERGAEEAFLGDGRGAGAAQLHQLVMVALHGMTIKDVGSLLVAKAEPVGVEGHEDAGLLVIAVTVKIERMGIIGDHLIDPEFLSEGTLLKSGIDWIFGDGTTVAQHDDDIDAARKA